MGVRSCLLRPPPCTRCQSGVAPRNFARLGVLEQATGNSHEAPVDLRIHAPVRVSSGLAVRTAAACPGPVASRSHRGRRQRLSRHARSAAAATRAVCVRRRAAARPLVESASIDLPARGCRHGRIERPPARCRDGVARIGAESNGIAEGAADGALRRGPEPDARRHAAVRQGSFSILGTPSERTPWILQFGGHHLALNITIAGPAGILTPSFIGAQPALFTLDGKTIRPLGEESDRALALLNALDAPQRSRATLNYRVADVVLGAGQTARRFSPKGSGLPR